MRKVRRREFHENRIICRRGEHGDGMYFVISGKLKVFVGNKLVGMLGPGQHFGEIALLDKEGKRTATVRTAMDSELYLLLRRDFMDVLELHPKFKERLLSIHNMARTCFPRKLSTRQTVRSSQRFPTRGKVRLEHRLPQTSYPRCSMPSNVQISSVHKAPNILYMYGATTCVRRRGARNG